MKVLFSTVVLLFSVLVSPISADYCYDYSTGNDWTCPYTCCYDFYLCCNSFSAVYWYAWVIIVIFVLLCVCACVGGGLGYRRYYVRRVYYQQVPGPTTTVVTAANQGYSQPVMQPAYNPNMAGYQAAPPKY